MCEKAEAISKEENTELSFTLLQQLHSEWKEIGPVGKNEREDIWKRFQTATKIVHKKRNDFFEKRKESFEENYQKKLSLCEQVEGIDFTSLSHHNKWQKQSELVNKLREDWKKIGPISREQNEKSWSRFITATFIYAVSSSMWHRTISCRRKRDYARSP